MAKATVNGISLNYKVHGDGEPLVMVMGFGGPRLGWFHQIRAFRKYYRVVTFDNRGIGGTDKPKESFTLETMMEDTLGLMEHLGIDRAHVLGYSLGGMIAQELAIRHPERVSKLILASTVSTTRQLSPELREKLGLGEEFSDEEARQVDPMKAMGFLISMSFNKWWYRTFLPAMVPVMSLLRWSKGLKGQKDAVVGLDTADRLPRIQAPTMVMVGTKDKVTPPEASEEMASGIPGAKLVKVAGGAHGYALEMRKEFNKEVLDFLSGD
jgi:pimeloyl-ACP methyl ester carboxylesterase